MDQGPATRAEITVPLVLLVLRLVMVAGTDRMIVRQSRVLIYWLCVVVSVGDVLSHDRLETQ